MIKFCEVCSSDTERRGDGYCKVCDRRRAQEKRDVARLAGIKLDQRKNRCSTMTSEQKKARSQAAERWKKAHPEWVEAYKLKNRDRMLARGKEWVAKNPERQRTRTAKYHAENPHKAVERSRVRRGALKNRMVKWRDDAAIKALYLQAAEFRAAGIDCEVDHIYPLQGKLVSGLHCEANLQIITVFENRSKQNRSPE